MRDNVVVLDQESLVLRVVDRAFDVVAGECADRIERIPVRKRHDLAAVAGHTTEQPRAAVARRVAILAQARLLDIRDVRIRVCGANRAAPDPRDHDGIVRGLPT